MVIRQEDSEELSLFQVDDLVLVQNTRRKNEENPKLQPKFVGSYEVVAAFGNHTYKLVRTTGNTERVPIELISSLY